MSSPGGSSDDVTLDLNVGRDEISDALRRTERAAEEADRALEELGATGERAGRRAAGGLNTAARAAGRARDAGGRFLPVNKRVNESLSETDRKGRRAARGMNAYERSIKQATRALGGMALMMALVKWGTIITGGAAAVGVISALAAGGVMAVGALSPMVGVLGVLGPALFMGAAAMSVFKIAGDDVKALMSPLLFDFLTLRTEITRRLTPGITALVSKLRGGLIPVMQGGLLTMADSISVASDRLGNMLTEAGFVNRVGEVFQNLDPLVQTSATTLGRFTMMFVYLTAAAMPMAHQMAAWLDRVTGRMERWVRAAVDSGRAQQWFLRAWETTLAVGRVLADFLVGLYHIFRLGGQVAREELGGGIAAAAQRFRDWTASGEGAARILRYFREAVPAIRETVKLLGAIAMGIGSFAANQDVAPLLAQIRIQLLPALGRLFGTITQAGGLGPALVSMFTAIADALAAIPLDSLVWLVRGIALLAQGISWLVREVPGAGPVLGFLLSLIVLGGTLGAVALWALKLYRGLSFLLKPLGALVGWVRPLLGPLGSLQSIFGVLSRVAGVAGTALRFLGMGLLFVGRALLGLFLANPITAAILIIVGILIFLWFKFDWFRNGVITALRAIGNFFVWVWEGVRDPVIAVLSGIWTVVKVIFGIIVGIVKIAVFVIVGILIGLLILGKLIFEGIGFAAKLAWEYVIQPVWNAISSAFWAVVNAIGTAWNWAMNQVGAAARWVYDTFIAPVVDLIRIAWSSISGPVMTLLGYLYGAWLAFRIFITEYVFRPIGDFFAWVWGGIEFAARRVADVITGVFHGAIDVVRGVYNFLAKGWNSIPGYTAPDWIPLIGGQRFELPKLPLLAQGGVIEYSTALVGEQGPEALVHGGRFMGILGAHGPEVVGGLPRGGYVVPNLDTLRRLPGLTKQIPAGVADAVSRALPGYGALLSRDRAPGGTEVQVRVDAGSDEVVEAIRDLTAAILARRDPPTPPVSVVGGRDPERDTALRTRYSYPSPRRPR